MTLDDCCIEPEQTFILHPDFDGSIQYLTKYFFIRKHFFKKQSKIIIFLLFLDKDR